MGIKTQDLTSFFYKFAGEWWSKGQVTLTLTRVEIALLASTLLYAQPAMLPLTPTPQIFM